MQKTKPFKDSVAMIPETSKKTKILANILGQNVYRTRSMMVDFFLENLDKFITEQGKIILKSEVKNGTT